MRINSLRALACLLALSGVSCGPGAANPQSPQAGATAPSSSQAAAGPAEPVEQYFTAPPEQRQQPPQSAPPPKWSFPTIADSRLDNGLSIKLLERSSLPLVQLELVVLSGQASDGDRPGLAVLAGEMLKVGGTGPYASRQLLDRVESLGSSLQIITGRDSTTISMRVTSDQLDEAMDLLGLVVRKPQFSAVEYRKLKRREMDRVNSLAKSSADWVSNMVVYRQLYGAGHPYAAYDATAKQVEKVQLWEAKRWHRTHVTPGNSFLVVAGDVTAERLEAAASRALGSWKGAAPPRVKPTTTPAPKGPKLFLVDRPDSTQAEVRWVTLGPTRQSEDWVPVKVGNQVLGGGVAGRLFLDVREKRSLAYSTYSSVGEVAQGPAPLAMRAGTQTAKAGLALKALLEHAQRMGAAAPQAEEVRVATRYMTDVFLLRLETVGAMASLTARLAVFSLPNDYFDQYRLKVRETTPSSVHVAAAKYFQTSRGLIVVAGDASRLGAVVSHFGPVQVLDPEKEFAVVREIAHDPSAPIELERIDGT